MEQKWDRYSDPPIRGISPVQILDENDNVLYTGWYIHHEIINYFWYDTITDEEISNNTAHIVAVTEYGDWNLKNELKLKRVTPPHKIKPVYDYVNKIEALKAAIINSLDDPNYLSMNKGYILSILNDS